MIQSSHILSFFNQNQNLDKTVLAYPTTERTTNKTNIKSKTILDLHKADGKQLTATEILMDTHFLGCTVRHVLRKLASSICVLLTNITLEELAEVLYAFLGTLSLTSDLVPQRPRGSKKFGHVVCQAVSQLLW